MEIVCRTRKVHRRGSFWPPQSQRRSSSRISRSRSQFRVKQIYQILSEVRARVSDFRFLVGGLPSKKESCMRGGSIIDKMLMAAKSKTSSLMSDVSFSAISSRNPELGSKRVSRKWYENKQRCREDRGLFAVHFISKTELLLIGAWNGVYHYDSCKGSA